MELALKAQVKCTDGSMGQVTRLIINPVSQKFTHIVVTEKGDKGDEYMIPVELITEANAKEVQLSITKVAFYLQKPFIEYELAPLDMDDPVDTAGVAVWPYASPDDRRAGYDAVKQTPHGELAVQRGYEVKATDGRVGTVSGFIVNPDSDAITHLVVHEKHMSWKETLRSKKYDAVPISDIDHTDNDKKVVYLKLDKKAVKGLTAVSAS